MPAYAKFDVWQSTAGVTIPTVLQVVSTQYTGAFGMGTITTPVDVIGFRATITPTSNTSKILVLVTGFMGGGNDVYPYLLLKRNGLSVGLGESSGGIATPVFVNFPGTAIGSAMNYTQRSIKNNFLDSPATTSAITYQIAMANPYNPYGTSSFINRQVTQDLGNAYTQQTSSSITLMEIGG
jgi:hypothetical protein